VKFREHRATLEQSMQTVVELPDLSALVEHIKKLLEGWPSAPVITTGTITVEPYVYDDRIEWNTHIVVLKKYGVVGFTDGPVNRGGPSA
jgi:hypothetical protein